MISAVASHLGLREEPFRDSLDERFYYPSPKHERAFATMAYCILQHEPAALIVGASGIGKSLVAKRLLSHLSQHPEFQFAWVIAAPGMPKTSLLREIAREADIQLDTRPTSATQRLLEEIQGYIIDLYASGRRLVFILDEVHFLPSQSLHLVRTLTNIETPEEKLITAVFIGEPRFLQRLSQPTYDSLRGRIKSIARLEPLSREETEQYIKHRLRVAGGSEDLFAPDTYDLIHQHSGGICRNINKIAGQALFNAVFADMGHVTRAAVEEAIADLEGIL
ncbi:MAG: AAA family ATPase [Armatimonadetes bacterium]|nr:AAA family ATPase [Armatimonadota bacterium]